MRSSNRLTTADPYHGGLESVTNKLTQIDSPFKGAITEAKLHALESIEASHHVPMRETQKMNQVNTPQYTDYNLAPYSRPMT
jgi:hypothetical protein